MKVSWQGNKYQKGFGRQTGVTQANRNTHNRRFRQQYQTSRRAQTAMVKKPPGHWVCHYCNRSGHIRALCYRMLDDQRKNIFRRTGTKYKQIWKPKKYQQKKKVWKPK